MDLLTRFRLAYQTIIGKANPLAPLEIVPGYDNEPQPKDEVNEAANLESYRKEPWIYRCINANAVSITSSPLIVEEYHTIPSTGELGYEPIEKGRLVDLFTMPNREFTIQEMLMNMSTALDGTGNAYVSYDKAATELWYVDPRKAKVIANTDKGVTGYEFNQYGRTIRLDRDAVCHVRLPNPFQQWYGLSPIEAAQMSILTLRYDRQTLKNFYKNGAIPSSVLESDQPYPGGDEMKKYRKEWNHIHSGGGNMQRTAFLWGGMKFKNVMYPIKDLVMDVMRKMNREEIAACFGVPPIMLGIVEDANRANSDDQMRSYYKAVIIPRQKLIASALTNQIIKPHFGDKYRVRFDNSQQDFLNEDENVKADTTVKIYRGGLVTLNEAREKLGFEPVDGDEGDQFYSTPSPFGDMGGFGEDNQDDENQDDENSDGGKDDSKGMPSPFYRKDATSRQRLWKAHDRYLSKYEKILEKKVIKYWTEQLDRVLSRLVAETSDGKFMSSIPVCFKAGNNNADGIFDKDAENEKLVKAIEFLVADVVRQSGSNAASDFGISMQFDVRNPEVQNLIGRFLNRSQRINDTTYQNVKDVLLGVYEDGVGIDEAERRLRDLFRSYYKTKPGDPGAITRGRRFATTEMNGLVSGASLESYKQAGLERKEWLAVQDGNTRDSHSMVDGEVKNINEPFSNMLMFPGDPEGLPGEVINCRCALLPVLD